MFPHVYVRISGIIVIIGNITYRDVDILMDTQQLRGAKKKGRREKSTGVTFRVRDR